MLSVDELVGSVRPRNVRPPSVAVPVLPLQVGLKLFQSVQPAGAARLPSASWKPVWSAIPPLVPQPVGLNDCGNEAEPAAATSEELKRLELEPRYQFPSECREEREVRKACPPAREDCWVELMA
jgi:hypothetical protein